MTRVKKPETMKHWVGKLKWLVAAFCMLAMFSAFVANVGVHNNLENIEVIEFEELEAVATRRGSHRQDKENGPSEFAVFDKKLKSEFSKLVLLRRRSERDRFNGLGTYLLT